ncbi:unnamed protein product [Aphanomyces euteiches]
MALSFMGNSVVEGLGDCVVDLANPMELVEFAVDGQSAESFLELAWENVKFKPAARGYQPSERRLYLHAANLQQEIGISVKQDTQVEVKTASCQGDLVVKPSKEKDAKSSTSTAQQEREPEPTTPSRDMQLFQIQGKSRRLRRIAQFIDEDDDMNETIRVQVDGEEREWTPLDFAVFMGYIEIVKNLVENPKVNKMAKPASYVNKPTNAAGNSKQ